MELVGGRLIEKPASRPINTVIASRAIYHLSAFVLPRDLGHVTAPDGGFQLASHIVRQPDAAFISKERMPDIPDHFDFAPDLAVEVVSPQEDVLKKVLEYLDAGTRMVWAIYPDQRQVLVFVYDGSGELRGRTFNLGDTLDGGDVLPGFTLAVDAIFPG